MNSRSVRGMLLRAGAPSILIDMMIPFMWFPPGAVDPDSPSIIEINKGMQRLLQAIGYYDVQVSGVLDEETAAALNEVSPPPSNWMQKTFVQIFGDLERARSAGRRPPRGGMADYFEYSGRSPGPLPGVIPGPLGMGAVVDAGVELSFGQGVRDKSVIVPIPRRSGVTYETFLRLQRAINRLLAAKSRLTGMRPGGRIGEDGVIGSGTLKAFRQVQEAHLAMSVPGDESSAGLAAHAASIARLLEGEADRLGVSRQENRGPNITNSSSEQTRAPMTERQVIEASTAVESGSAWTYLPLLAIAGGIALYAASKSKKKRRKK